MDEPDAFRDLVERYQGQATGHALAILGNLEDSRDAVQDAFIRIFRRWRSYDQSRPFYPYFYTVLRHICFRRLRGRRREREVPYLEPAPSRDAAEVEALQVALDRLSPEDRELVTLKHLDGLTYEELAEMLDIPPGTVMSRLWHARRRLREIMERNRDG
jgi:RNA polymerase sigma-70 factor (ECF subfamily)